ncbi:hypothetical protein [Paenibacillus eucommiae]|uniref:Na+/melibiose symporter-like transporter n=1 Tax=Paenibacillus eucommiae TaxID=1355755 RepID=A0ABS4J114_9BACL|nr:hypothetical protein [Paenibacillus eucommiae]MBP1992474.1 Na+/melibiose symporter-like transporter [Paenibacillus eucommiae]
MFTYFILIVAAVFLLIKWTAYARYKKQSATNTQIDDALIVRLNRESEPHEK